MKLTIQVAPAKKTYVFLVKICNAFSIEPSPAPKSSHVRIAKICMNLLNAVASKENKSKEEMVWIWVEASISEPATESKLSPDSSSNSGLDTKMSFEATFASFGGSSCLASNHAKAAVSKLRRIVEADPLRPTGNNKAAEK